MMREHIDEIPSIITEFGVPSFKIFMFYGSHGLHGRSQDQSEFLMIPPGRALRPRPLRVRHAGHPAGPRGAARARRPDLAVAALRDGGDHDGLHQAGRGGRRARRASRHTAHRAHQHSEGLAITIASFLADETELPNINLLHLTSAKALKAAMLMQQTFPHVNFRREVTIGHLVADFDTASGIGGKVNPPLRAARGRRERCGSTFSRATSTGSSATTPAARRR